MTITSTQTAALRSVLTGDSEAFHRLSMEPDLVHGDGFPILIATAFVAAARRRFRADWSNGDVIRFVGQVRARSEGEHADLSAVAAEQMLLSALRGKPISHELDENTKGYAQVAILAELVSDLDEQQLDVFLAEAREQADTWLVNHHSQGHAT